MKPARHTYAFIAFALLSESPWKPTHADSPAAPSAAPVLEEVVVTARRREESDIRVPVATTNFSESQLNAFATQNLYDVAAQVPSLVVGDDTGPFGSNLALHGVGTSSFSATTDQSVSLNVDGLSLNKGFAGRVGLLDTQQIEIFKGPQSLYFGKSSSAGVIAIKSADPTGHFEAGGNVGYETEAQETKGQGFVSGPLTSTLKGRLALSYSSSVGFFRNVAEAAPGLGGLDPAYRRVPNTKEFLARGTLLWDPSEQIDAKLKLTVSDTSTRGDGGLQMYSYCPAGPIDATENCHVGQDFAVADLDPTIFKGVPNNGVPFVRDRFNLGSLQVNFRPSSSVALTSITGIVWHENGFLINGTAAPGATDITSSNPFLQAAFAPFPVPAQGVTISAWGSVLETNFSEELRLTTSFPDSSVNGMLGAFYEHDQLSQLRDDNIPLFGGNILIYRGDMSTDTYSGFGQLTWNIISQLELAGGVRYTDSRRNFTLLNQLSNTNISTAVPNIDQSNVSPEVTLTWRPEETLTVYGALKKGFKSGSFNLENANVLPTSNLSYRPETVKGGEIGIKALLLERRFRFNATVYDYQYNDLQVSQTFYTPPAFTALLTSNAATATTKGVDVDAAFAAAEGLTLNGAVSYNKAAFDNYTAASCWGGQTIALGCNLAFSPAGNSGFGGFTAQNLSDRPLPRAPLWSGNVGFDYQHALPGTRFHFGLAGSANYSDKLYTDPGEAPGTLQASYVKVNAALRVFDEDKKWEAALIGDNLGNRIVTPLCFVGAESKGELTPNLSGLPFTNGQDDVACFPEQGRSIWLRLTYKYTGS